MYKKNIMKEMEKKIKKKKKNAPKCINWNKDVFKEAKWKN